MAGVATPLRLDAFEDVIDTPSRLQHVEALEAGETTLEDLDDPLDARLPWEA